MLKRKSTGDTVEATIEWEVPSDRITGCSIFGVTVDSSRAVIQIGPHGLVHHDYELP